MKNLASEERAILSKVLWHLKEIDQRKLYSNQACGSLFEYCVKILKYSEGQASRRVTACRLLRELPELASKIEEGSLNLTQLNQAKNFFSEENITDKKQKNEIIKQLEDKSTRESEKILWGLKKEDAPIKVTVTMKEETHIRLKKLQALKAHTCPDMDTFFEKVCEELEVLWNPINKKLNRVKDSKGATRYIAQKDRVFVWKRDQGKCKICGSSYALEIDHIKPFALGGKTKPDNLRLLCRNCNQRLGIEVFGDNRRFKN